MDPISDTLTSSPAFDEMVGFTFYPWVLGEEKAFPQYVMILWKLISCFSPPFLHMCDVRLRGSELNK